MEARAVLPVLAVALIAGAVSQGEIWFVNNNGGDDANEGTSSQAPFATIAKAVASARTSDAIVLADTGIPYREPIRLRRLGGTPAKPLVIEGNGATITGLRRIPAEAWERRGDGVFFHPVAKKPYGAPFLVHRRRKLPTGKGPDELGPGEHVWTERGIAFRLEDGKDIEDYELEATLVVSGLEIASASYITCRNLVSEFHSNDGFNVHGDCRGIVCENIVGRHNGDDGFSVHETIGSVVRNGHFHHNMWGIQDVNASRSVFRGVTCEHNAANGAHFVGGYHSLTDSIVRANAREQIAVTSARPGHLVGAEHDPLCEGLVYLQNVVTEGGSAGLSVRDGARVTARHCTFVRSDVGVVVHKESTLHLTASLIAECESRELASASPDCFRDHNLYHPGRFRWQGKDFGPQAWDAFRHAAGHDAHSRLAHPQASPDAGLPSSHSPAPTMKPRPGPTAPVRGYVGAVGEWSEAVRGLRCRLAAASADVPVGARLVLWLQFRVEPEGLPGDVETLNRFLHPRCVTLTFTDRETGKSFTRRPDGAVPELPMLPDAEDFAPLRDGPLAPERLLVRLLASAGRQLPRGRYRVTATYANDGRYDRDAWKGPGTLWAGTVATPAIALTVRHAEPETVEIPFHSALTVRRAGDQIAYGWSEANPRRLRLTRRPGFLLGTRYETHVFVGGEEVGGQGGGGLSSSTWLAGGESFLSRGSARFLDAGNAVRICQDVQIFETSVPAGHAWRPEAGDDEVLWKGTVEGTLAPAEGEAKP
ncbi:MAG: right-handed parallel beta-helix repeat-containing protein [Planctomycetota bacterium]